MHALSAHRHTRQIVKKSVRLVIGHLDDRLGRRLLHIKLEVSWG
jgi:hypothetical protein